ncbi:helix-turn-helix transcriptional regulator [Fictibacillus enclensis]|uniref:helix-turn-helix domain-containing protein n=1 Tax=Fictibacillus enclensis TaxID=1017270 RepID=UPI0025A27FA9|nr:helix-turn-helix transcriptional regulator [Fictibacillus enclensis]MDM5336502.1 helix-turn-helix transcriptional regulator [Fictibacillus enclensis]
MGEIRGEKIKYFREIKQLTQRELTDGICSITYLSKVENNIIEPSEQILQLWCSRLGIEYSMFVQSSSALTFKQELKMWYEAIKLRDRSLSKRYYQTIKDQVTGIEDIDILASFHLVSSRHFLLSQLYNDAKYHLTRVKHYVSCLSNELSAYYYYFNGLYEYLNGNIQQALNDFFRAKETVREPEFYYQLGLIYGKLGRMTLSIVNTEKALASFNQHMLIYKMVDCYILLGINYNRINEHETAKSYFEKALNGVNSLQNSRHLLSKIYHNLGCVYQRQKNSEEAILYFLKSLQECTELRERRHTIYLLARELYTCARIDESRKWLKKGLQLSPSKNDDTYYLLKTLEFQLEEKQNEPGYLQFLEEKAVPFFQYKNDVFNIGRCYELLAHSYYCNKRYKKASDYYSKAYELKIEYN